MRADAARNRERIMDAASAVLAADGPDAPLDHIARTAGVGPGTLHRHFPTKEALISAVLADRMKQLAAEGLSLRDAPDPVAAFEMFVSNVVANGRRNAALGAALGGGAGHLSVSAEELSTELANLLRRAQLSGGIRPDVDMPSLHGILRGLLVMAPEPDSSRGDLTLSIVLRGLRAD
jgi:AcrR family transcriptional regulator